MSLSTITAVAAFGKLAILDSSLAVLRCAWHSVTSRDRVVVSVADRVWATAHEPLRT